MQSHASIEYCQFGTAPTEVDNGNHIPATEDKWWQESILFCWGDARRGHGGWMRFAIHPNQRVANLYCWIVCHGRTVYRKQMTDLPLPQSDLTNCTLENFSVKTIKPLLEYELAMDVEDLQVKLRWKNFDWPVSMSLNVGNAKLASGHYNMMGDAIGEIAYKGEIQEFHGSGFSDHSWGVRRKQLPASRSYFCVFDSTFYLMAMPVLTDAGTKHVIGYVCYDGKLARLGSDSKYGYAMHDDWVTVAGCDSFFYDDLERGYHIKGRTVSDSSTWAMGHGKLVHHAIAQFECGGRLGRGILETSLPKRMRPDQIAEAGLDPESWWLNEQ